jgi:hypothetical protein
VRAEQQLALAAGNMQGRGLAAWQWQNAAADFGIDRSGPSILDRPQPPRGLLVRIRDAWRAARSAWKFG